LTTAARGLSTEAKVCFGAERGGKDRLRKLPLGKIPFGSCHLGEKTFGKAPIFISIN